MRVVCIFPVTGNIQNAPQIMTEFRDSISKRLRVLGATDIELKFAGTEYVFVSANETLEGQPKGKGILQCLKNTPSTPDVVICCDGSNKIPYSHIPDLFQELISDSSVACVMANRKRNKAVIPIRYLIERFEVYSLKKYHKSTRDIPDGQCGLWAYRAKSIRINGKEEIIDLHAEGYDIELDLLDEILSKKLNHSFVDIVLPELPIKTGFMFTDNIKKMKFLICKNGHFKDSLQEYIMEFEKLNEFKSYEEDAEVMNSWTDYKKEVIRLGQNQG